MKNLKEQIETVKGIVEDGEYDLKSARSPKRKRTVENSIQFFKSILKSLQELDTIKNAK